MDFEYSHCRACDEWLWQTCARYIDPRGVRGIFEKFGLMGLGGIRIFDDAMQKIGVCLNLTKLRLNSFKLS